MRGMVLGHRARWCTQGSLVVSILLLVVSILLQIVALSKHFILNCRLIIIDRLDARKGLTCLHHLLVLSCNQCRLYVPLPSKQRAKPFPGARFSSRTRQYSLPSFEANRCGGGSPYHTVATRNFTSPCARQVFGACGAAPRMDFFEGSEKFEILVDDLLVVPPHVEVFGQPLVHELHTPRSAQGQRCLDRCQTMLVDGMLPLDIVL